MRVVSTAPRRPTVTGTDLLNLAGARPRTSRRAYYLNNVSDNHYFKACRQPLHPSQRPYLKHESSTATCTRSNAQPFACWPIRRPTYAIRDYDRCSCDTCICQCLSTVGSVPPDCRTLSRATVALWEYGGFASQRAHRTLLVQFFGSR